MNSSNCVNYCVAVWRNWSPGLHPNLGHDVILKLQRRPILDKRVWVELFFAVHTVFFLVQ